LLKPKGDLCFIQKSTALLYNKGVKNFRDSLFNQFHVHQIIDFTLLKKDLYKSKSKIKLDDFGNQILDDKGKPEKTKSTSVESCAVFYKKEKVENYNSLHIISRLLKNTKEGLSFEFDFYDFYEISKNQVLEDDTVWRCNLLGGNRLNHLIEKLNRKTHYQTNLKDYVLNHLMIDENAYGEGFFVGNKKKTSKLITKHQNLRAKKFSLDKFELTPFVGENKFEATRNELILFKTPLIAIKENIVNNKFPIVSFDKIEQEYIPFDSQIVGISFADKNYDDLLKLKIILTKNEKTNALKTLSTCSKFFLGESSVINKKEIDNWIIPLDNDEVKLSESEKIVMNDVLDYIYPSWYEQNPKINHETTSPQITDFADIFNQAFNSIYKKENKEQRLRKLLIGNDFIGLEFYYSNENYETETVLDADFQIDEIIKNNISPNVVINRVLKIYGENTITLIKPKNLRFWLKSIALRDADDVFDDIIENGLK
jgi:hypothetical protein